MKKIFTFLLLALMVQVGFTQEQEEIKKEKKESDINTIFTEDNFKITGGLLGPEFKVSDTYDDYGLLIGLKLGGIVNDNFFIGLAGYGLTTKSTFHSDGLRLRVGMGYGGLAMEYTIMGKKALHFSIPVLVGVGGYTFYEENDDPFWNDYNDVDNTVAFIVEPGVNVELNITKFLRFSTGVSYRYVTATQLDVLDISNADLSNLSYNASFKFGFF
jgi:hypothetical protein